MRSRATPRFWTAYRVLPADIRRLAEKAYRLFRRDPGHQSLRFKKIHKGDKLYSVRISYGYRAVGLVDGDQITWIWIGSHGEYDRLLRTL